MSDLTPRDLELVALGAAMGSNCVPCVEHHIAESRNAGLGDAEIHAAIEPADRIRQVPARNALQAALNRLPAAEPQAAKAETEPVAQPSSMMMGMMSKMIDACRGQAASAPGSAPKQPAVAATHGGCGCG